MPAAVPPGFHIEVWREGSEVLMVFSGEAGFANSAELALALGPDVCRPGDLIAFDLEALTIADFSFAYSLANIVQGASVSVLASISDSARAALESLASLDDLTAVRERQVYGSCWKLHSFELPAAAWTSAFARDRAGEVAADAGISPNDSDGIRMAVGEAVCNALRHGCLPFIDACIKLRCIADANTLEVIVSDSGAGFDPLCTAKSEQSASGKGGHGISIMRETVDDVAFGFDNGTIVRLVKRLTQKKPQCD